MRHGMEVGHLPVVSPDPVNFPSNDDISGRARYHKVKAHGKFLCHTSWEPTLICLSMGTPKIYNFHLSQIEN